MFVTSLFEKPSKVPPSILLVLAPFALLTSQYAAHIKLGFSNLLYKLIVFCSFKSRGFERFKFAELIDCLPSPTLLPVKVAIWNLTPPATTQATLPYLLQDLGNPISITGMLRAASVTREFAYICDTNLRSPFVSLVYTNLRFNSLSACHLFLSSAALNKFRW